MKRFASVIITAWNRRELMEPCLESLWKHTTYPYELVIHDDGSRLENTQWLQKLLAQGKISTLICNPPGHNRGHGTSVNRAVDVSEGDPIIKLDGEERFADGWLEKVVKALDLFPEIKLLHCSYYFTTPSVGDDMTKMTWQWKWDLHRETREDVTIRVVWVGPGADVAWRRKTWNEEPHWYNIMSPGFVEDMDFRLHRCPMMRLMPESNSKEYPPVTDPVAHWEKYKNTPWLAVLDPPVISYCPGWGQSCFTEANKTLKEGPHLLGVR